MTRVFGTLFPDKRNGTLVIRPSKPFFGVDRHDKHFNVEAGYIDIDLPSTPRGVYYNVGFKDYGDTRSVDFTLQWRIPFNGQVNITPQESPETQATEPRAISSTIEKVQVRRLSTELAGALELIEKLERDLECAHQREAKLNAQLDQLMRSTEVALEERDRQLVQLSYASTPKVHTVVRTVPVPPENLTKRIQVLEQENIRLLQQNSEYYKSVLELHQLKLDRAPLAHVPDDIPELDGSPQQRLLRKLRTK